MRSSPFLLALLLSTAVSARAHGQSPTAQEITTCITKADAGVWNSLGLTADQVRRAEELRAQVNAGQALPNATTEQLKTILGSETFAKFTTWCASKR